MMDIADVWASLDVISIMSLYSSLECDVKFTFESQAKGDACMRSDNPEGRVVVIAADFAAMVITHDNFLSNPMPYTPKLMKMFLRKYY